ncbi:MAG: response regulator [Desulfobacterales bacterium]|nr:response regulator [Desulfobacterales bacterium]
MPFDIIITDDSRVARAMIKKAMPAGDYVFREAGGGVECLALYKKKPADAVFLDLTMPEMDGFETLERLRKMDPGAKVVVITADVQPGARDRVTALGALSVLHKPPRPEDLEAVLKRILA